MINIKFITLGCPKNRVDTEYMLGMLQEKNKYNFVENPKKSNVIVINTCGFIDDAKEESIETIFDSLYYKNEGYCQSVIITGCLTQRYKNKIIKKIPEIDAILGTGNFDQLPEVIEKSLKGKKINKISEPTFEYSHNLPRELTSNHYAYLKIAEGCNNNCTYCTIPQIRGPLNSRSIDDIYQEAKKLSDQGIKELILIAQDLTQYGVDLYGEVRLVSLLERLVKIKNIKWIRLMYTYPERISDDLIKIVRREPKICNYLDLPIQHSANVMRKRMGRKGDREDLVNLIEKLRNNIPDITLRTSLIVGFPGEKDKYFYDLLSFIDKIKFDRLGVFKYSREEDTPAYHMKPRVKEEVKQNRYDQIMNKQREISLKKNRKQIGRKINVMIDEINENNKYAVGRSQYDAPEIDNQIFIEEEELSVGDFVTCRVQEAYEYDLFAKKIGENHNENKSSK